jgi:hypothetical protein
MISNLYILIFHCFSITILQCKTTNINKAITINNLKNYGFWREKEMMWVRWIENRQSYPRDRFKFSENFSRMSFPNAWDLSKDTEVQTAKSEMRPQWRPQRRQYLLGI